MIEQLQRRCTCHQISSHTNPSHESNQNDCHMMLTSVQARWTAAAEKLGAAYTNLTGDMLLSAAAISYLGAFTAPLREEALAKWAAECTEKQIPASGKFTLTEALGGPVRIRRRQLSHRSCAH